MKSGTLRALARDDGQARRLFPGSARNRRNGAGYETYTWNALFAPAGTPADVVARLNAASKKAMADPEVIKRMNDFSATIVASSPEELAAHVKAEVAKWTPIVRDAHITLD